MTHSNIALEINKLSKNHGLIEALKDVSIKFSNENIYGLFGRNGAGKTTLLDIVSSRIYADRGDVTCFGKNISQHPEAIAKNCCYMPEKHYFPKSLKIKSILSYAKKSYLNYDEAYADKLCKTFDLNINQKYEALSRGFQSILRIVIGLASHAPITIFDEPVLGLDAVARDRFYSELIETFTKNPRLFIISTHLIEESADLFNEAIIIKNGRVIKQASVEALLSNAFYVSGTVKHVNSFIQNKTLISTQTINNMKTAVVEGDLNQVKQFSGLQFSQLTMQKLFIHLTDDNLEKGV